MGNDMVASLYSRDPETQRLGQRDEIAKADVVRGGNDALEQFSRSHLTRNVAHLDAGAQPLLEAEATQEQRL